MRAFLLRFVGQRGWRCAMAVCCVLMFPADVVLAGHPFHATSAELEWNAKSQWFEVALKLPGLVIEDELSRLHQRRVNLETTADGEQLLQEYVTSRFLMTDRDHAACEIRWVGMEVEVRDVWAYFEIRPQGAVVNEQPASTSTGGGFEKPTAEGTAALPFRELKVSCRLLETRVGQVNMVTLRAGTQRASLHLAAEQWERAVEFGAANEKLLRGWSVERR